MNKMKIQPELCGYTLEKFNKLMFRLSRFSPDWANHIKITNNVKTNCTDFLELDIYSKADIINWDESIILKNKIRVLSNPDCCIVGETYNNTENYAKCSQSNEICEICSKYSFELYDSSRIPLNNVTTSHITDLKILDKYVTHLEKEHKNLIKVEIK